jgi:signal transduction histidine kinase
VIEVTDEGEGIAASDHEKIFDEFVQLGKTQLTEGTGLGLPISRRLAEMLHGTLDVESEVGQGSTFRLTLPPTAETASARGTREPGAGRAAEEQTGEKKPKGKADSSAVSR